MTSSAALCSSVYSPTSQIKATGLGIFSGWAGADTQHVKKSGSSSGYGSRSGSGTDPFQIEITVRFRFRFPSLFRFRRPARGGRSSDPIL
eukprot:8548709-Pyramimonas_sp.AAC.1